MRVEERPLSAAVADEPAAKPARKSRLKGFLVNLGGFLLSAVVTFALLEIVFRTFFPQPLYAVQYAPWGFAHTPNTEFWHGSHAWAEGRWLNGVEFLTYIKYNSHGFRDYERALVKPAGTLRIAVLGDSYGEGMEVQLEETTAKVLERQLNDWIASGAAQQASSLPKRPVDQSAAAALAAGQQLVVAPESMPVSTDPTASYTAADEWYRTRMALKRLDLAAAATGARVLVANVMSRGADYTIRQEFLDRIGVPIVDVSTDLKDPANRYGYHLRYDGHWNAAGHARAADLIFDKIVSQGLLQVTSDTRAVETINMSMSAYSTCKELMLYEAQGWKFHPDLVLVIYTGADDRTQADAALCTIEPDGRLVTRPATFSQSQELVRAIKGYIKRTSHFLTFVMDRITRVDAIAKWNLQFEDQYRTQNVPVD